MKSFRYATKNVLIVNHLTVQLRNRGYDVEILEKLPDEIIERGITISGSKFGVGVAYYLDKDPETYTNLEDLYTMLRSDRYDSFSLAKQAVLELEDAMHRDALDALLHEVPALKTFLEDAKKS